PKPTSGLPWDPFTRSALPIPAECTLRPSLEERHRHEPALRFDLDPGSPLSRCDEHGVARHKSPLNCRSAWRHYSLGTPTRSFRRVASVAAQPAPGTSRND